MSSTTKDAENGRESGRPTDSVEDRRSAASSFLDDICRLVTLPGISAILDIPRTFRCEEVFQASVSPGMRYCDPSVGLMEFVTQDAKICKDPGRLPSAQVSQVRFRW